MFIFFTKNLRNKIVNKNEKNKKWKKYINNRVNHQFYHVLEYKFFEGPIAYKLASLGEYA